MIACCSASGVCVSVRKQGLTGIGEVDFLHPGEVVHFDVILDVQELVTVGAPLT
jgi:hypothetical protein